MNYHLGTLAIGLLLAIGINTSMSRSAMAENETYFCSVINNRPSTVYQSSRGNKAIITWVQSVNGYSAEERCQKVSARFQAAYTQGILKYLTTGKMNGQPVICASRSYGGGCDMVLFVVGKDQDPQQVIENLIDIRRQEPIVIDTNLEQPYYSIEELTE